MKEAADKSLDPQLWHACAGSMVQIPSVNSKVFYFPQGHAEHTQTTVDFPSSRRIPALVLCRVTAVKFLADPETDEVHAKITLIPLPDNSIDLDLEDNNVVCPNGTENPEKPASFAKTLTQSDANNGGGFSVPRYCAETIFPRLDYSADPPVQTVIAKDVHGEIWKFRHIYRGTPRRHLLTTGWSAFVNQKKLVAGDSIVFLRAENGDLCIGIRRVNRGMGNGNDSVTGWNSGPGNCVNPYAGISVFLREDEGKITRNGCNRNLSSGPSGLGGLKVKGKVRPDTVVEAAMLAVTGQPFEVVYYPRASTPEFCVKAATVRTVMRIHWCSGMRFKMAFETEDSSRISWFSGTVSSVQVADPIRWPNSPWRLLQVTWDEPDLLPNVKRISPWLVELVSNMPVINLSPFAPPRKKLRFQPHLDFPLGGQFPMSSFTSNPLGSSSPLCYLSDNTPAGIQGARHAQYGFSLSDLQLNSKLQSGLFSSSFQQFDSHSRVSDGIMTGVKHSNDKLSCLLSMGSSNQNLEKSDNVKKHQFLLFGQPILTEQQMSRSCSSVAVSQLLTESSSERNREIKKKGSDGSGAALELHVSPDKLSSAGYPWHQSFHATDSALDIGCKVFLESQDLGRTLDLSLIGSYEELYCKLANMFGIERSEMMSHILYRDSTGAVKQAGDDPFSDFVKTAKRLTILLKSGNDIVERTWVMRMRSAENGLEASNKTGPLTIFA
ncbi:auxin response factor 18 [Tripterygium wilfordii]|uniref:Auxin response factor n=1 Tax=Tripterygium wilfordii TaxID=458696 RepID=A0A7J7C105_TRIWF|nr:auxin response factor 18-like [Tripterygium wilfordii]KAF5727456.1 auxin response factor 18 [Tripterygium wilfordii]